MDKKSLPGLPSNTVGSVGLDGPDFLDTLFSSASGVIRSNHTNLASLQGLSEKDDA
jgi:hypothetical protein